MCAGVPRIFTSGPLDSKLRANGLCFSGCCYSGRDHGDFAVPASLPKWLLCYFNQSHQHPARSHEHGSPCARARLDRGTRKLTVHGPGIATPNERDGPGALWRRNSHAGLGPQPRQQAISVSLERSVVLTMGRLVASNSTCFASGPASSLLPTNRSAAARERMDDSTTRTLSRTAKESKGFLGICSIPVFSPPHNVACLLHLGKARYRSPRPRKGCA